MCISKRKYTVYSIYICVWACINIIRLFLFFGGGLRLPYVYVGGSMKKRLGTTGVNDRCIRSKSYAF